MMTALPYNFQSEVSSIAIPQISASAPKWKPILEEVVDGEEEAGRGFHKSDNNNRKTASSIEHGTSSPTSTSTLSSFNGSGGGCAVSYPGFNPAGCGGGGTQEETGGWVPSELRNVREAGMGTGASTTASSVTAVGGGGSEGSGFGGVWDGLLAFGDGNLLPWIMGENDDVCGLKHLLQSGNFSEIGGNAGVANVDHVSGLETVASPMAGTTSSNLEGSNVSGVCDTKRRNDGSVSQSFASDGLGGKVNDEITQFEDTNVVAPLHNGLAFPVSLHPVGADAIFQAQLNLIGDKPQIFDPQQLLLLNQPQTTQSIHPHPDLLLPTAAAAAAAYYQQQEEHIFPPPLKRHNPGVVIDPYLGQLSKSPILDRTTSHGFLPQTMTTTQPNPMIGLPPHHLPPPDECLADQKPLLVPRPKMVMGVVGNEFPTSQLQNPTTKEMNQNDRQFQDQALRDQLCKAADLIQSGKFSLAQEILARLNQQLSLSIPGSISNKPPLTRACFYVKEALHLLLSSNPIAGHPPSKSLTPFDLVHKLNAFKVFSEVSPVLQFMNFTRTQAILEAVGDSGSPLHILDFDIGCGAQWASFIQELSLRKRGIPSLKITAFASISSSHPFELTLVRDNLVQFSNEVGVALDFQVISLESFDPSTSTFPSFMPAECGTIAVSFPVWTCSNCPYLLPSLLCFVKQNKPKIILSMDRGSDRWDLPFPQHVLHSLDLSYNLLESLNGMGSIPMDIMSKFEKFFVQPSIENALLGRLEAPDKMPHWKHLFASAGLLPLVFSNFTEAQGDYLVKRNPGRGFHVEQQHGSLVLSWQRREIVAASAWRC